MRKHLIFIFLAAVSFSVFFNELNLNFIDKNNPQNANENTFSLVHESTIWSIDNNWYLPQIKHLLNGDGYTLDPEEPEMRVRRTPIYPLFYGFFYTLFGEKDAHFSIRYFQVFLFALSALMLVFTSLNLLKDKKVALIGGYVYASSPFIFSFCYFTITESITPFFVVGTLFLFSQFVKLRKLKWLIFAGIALGIAMLHRPTIGIILLGIGSYLFFSGFEKGFNLKNLIIQSLAIFSGLLIVIGPWIVRNYLVSEELIPLEKYYHEAPMDYGKAHVELRYLTSAWTNPANLSAEGFSNTLIGNINKGNKDLNQEVISSYIDKWPKHAFRGFTSLDLKEALLNLNECFIFKAEYYKTHPKALRAEKLNLDCEVVAYRKLTTLRNKFISNSPFRYYILTPITTTKELIFNSFLHHFALINPRNRNLSPTQLIGKSFSYLLNVLYYFSLLYFIILSKYRWDVKGLLLVPTIFLFVALTEFLFRYVEIRYLLPLYPLLTISLSFMIVDLTERLSNFYKNRSFILTPK